MKTITASRKALMEHRENAEHRQTFLNRMPWGLLIALSFTGQLAWAVEINWFGTFAYDLIRPNKTNGVPNA